MRWDADALDAPHSRREIEAVEQPPSAARVISHCPNCGTFEGHPHPANCAENDGRLVQHDRRP